jgi:energy-coupling factor transporter ATP-binding protein EcfA2
MEASLILGFCQANDRQDFQVKIQLTYNDQRLVSEEVECSARNTIILFRTYQIWSQSYQQLRHSHEYKAAKSLIETHTRNAQESADTLRKEFQNWLAPIEDKLKAIDCELSNHFYYTADCLKVFIQSDHSQIKQLPWNEWNFSLCQFTSIEIILSHTHLPRLDSQDKQQKQVLVVVDDIDFNQYSEPKLNLGKIACLLSTSDKLLNSIQVNEKWCISCWISDDILKDNLIFEDGFRNVISNTLYLIVWNDNLHSIKGHTEFEMIPMIIMQESLSTHIAQEFLACFLEYYIQRNQNFYAAVREARERLEPFEQKFPGIQGIPIISHHPDHRVLRWQEYCQGKYDRKCVVLPSKVVEQRIAVIERLKKEYSNNLIESLPPVDIGIQKDLITQQFHLPEQFDLPKLKDYFKNLPIQFGIGETLLILGEAGSGKSTVLLEITREILKQLQAEYDQPIPVILNLATWAQNKLSLEDWIVGEMERKYEIQATLSRTWLCQEQVTLMLDGLDEVAKSVRGDCLRQIRTFALQRQETNIVVCCRASVYETLGLSLEFRAIVKLMPLSDKQIDQILQQQGESASGLTDALNRDRTFRQFAQSPLVLKLLLSVFQRLSTLNISSLTTDQERYHYVFAAYIDQSMERTPRIERDRPRYERHLSWLAARLSEESLTEFWIEQLQPKWLKSKMQTYLYKIIFSTNFALIFGILLAIIVWLALGMVATEVISIIVALIVSSFCSLMFGIWVWLTFAKEQVIRPVETLNWSWRVVLQSIIVGGAIGAGVAIFSKLIGFVFVGPLIVLTTELKGSRLRERTFANEGIWKSLNHALLFAALASITFGIAATVFMPKMIGLFGDLRWLSTHPESWIIWFKLRLIAASCVTGFFFGLNSAGIACVQHLSLRIVLTLKGYLPFNYARFLDNASERALLRKVGGGYMFMHPLLQEHFSQLNR